MLLKSIGLKEIPENSVLLIEEDLGGIKSIFLQLFGLDSLKNGKKVLYISTRRSKEDIIKEIEIAAFKMGKDLENLTILGDFKSRESLIEICKRNGLNQEQSSLNTIKDADICIIDTFSALFLEESIRTIASDLETLLKISRSSNVLFLLASDTGILREREERFVRSMVDGIIQFKTETGGGKINRYISIPKMKGTPPPNKMIPFKVSETGIAADTRERVG